MLPEMESQIELKWNNKLITLFPVDKYLSNEKCLSKRVILDISRKGPVKPHFFQDFKKACGNNDFLCLFVFFARF